MSEIKQRIVQAAVDGNIWLVSQLVEELEAQHEKELQEIKEASFITVSGQLDSDLLADLYKNLQKIPYTVAQYEEPSIELLSTTIRMEGENQFQEVKYRPCCKHGYDDCIWDPAYIYNTYPEWYKRLYGDKLPEEITCESCEHGERWDDEDK